MNCTNCGAEISYNTTVCMRCGQPTQPAGWGATQPAAGGAVRLDFVGTAIQLLGWILLGIVASLAIIPIAWVQAAQARWLCRNLRFSDGTTAQFTGTGGQIVGWMILYMAVVGIYFLAIKTVGKEHPLYIFPILIVYILAIAAIGLKLLGWFVSNVQLSSGSPLSFRGGFGGFIGWILLVGVSIYTIIGWAWATAGMYRWFTRNTVGQGVQFQFNGKGHEILWRCLVLIVTCIFIIPIPWMYLWFLRWLVQSVTMTRTAGMVPGTGSAMAV